MCLKFLHPIEADQAQGFSTGYLIGCAFVSGVLLVEFILGVLLQ